MAELEVAGRTLTIRNLERVVFPATGTTKAQLLDYYARISAAMLPHLRERQLHMHRYPEGVGGPSFWQKACPEHKPDWVPLAPAWSEDKGEDVEYCVVNEPAALLWAVNLGSIELHTSLHRRDDMQRPTALAFDLDPGPGAGLLECCEVALRLRDLFDGPCFPKTSGSKGLQVYVPLDGGETYDDTKPLARRVAELLEAETPDRVVSRMARDLRAGKVLIDWSQNTAHKSTVCVYSVRAKERPTVSTPLLWDEVAAAVDAGDASALRFEMQDVLARVDEHGDLFAAVSADRPRVAADHARLERS